jgi:hypothetical protein
MGKDFSIAYSRHLGSLLSKLGFFFLGIYSKIGLVCFHIILSFGIYFFLMVLKAEGGFLGESYTLTLDFKAT